MSCIKYVCKASEMRAKQRDFPLWDDADDGLHQGSPQMTDWDQ